MSAQLKPVPPVFRTIEANPEPREATGLAGPRAPGAVGSRFGWMRSRTTLWVAGGLLVAVIATVVASRASAPKPVAAIPPSQTITVGSVTRDDMQRQLVLTGSLAAWDELPIGAEAGGLAITEVAAEEGDRVTRGQLLARAPG